MTILAACGTAYGGAGSTGGDGATGAEERLAAVVGLAAGCCAAPSHVLEVLLHLTECLRLEHHHDVHDARAASLRGLHPAEEKCVPWSAHANERADEFL